MIGFMFHYLDSTRTAEYNLWDDFLAIWKFDILIMIDPSHLYPKRKHRYDTIEEAISNYDVDFIALEPSGEIELKDFDHPQDVIYILGSNNWKTGESHIPKEIPRVRIDTPISNKIRPMRDISTAICIAYDRWNKS